MISSPSYWRKIGQPITVAEIEATLIEIIEEIDCDVLTLSGGVDSSLILWYMAQSGRTIRALTTGLSEDHPDIIHAKMVANLFDNVEHHVLIPTDEQIANEAQPGDYDGDATIRLFYKWVGEFTNEVVAGDGIDEFMCGYYAHLHEPNEETYYNFMRRLQEEQLIPLDKNSGDIGVILPYMDYRLTNLLAQIPISEKVDESGRKLLISKLATGKLPESVIHRRKYGFCDAMRIKE